MAVVVGNLGAVKIAADTVMEIDQFSLTYGGNMESTESFGDTWEKKTPTLGRWNGSFAGRLDPADTTGHTALRTAALNRTSVALRLYENATKYYSGTAFIEPTVTNEERGVLKVSYNFTGSGALSYT